MNSELLKLVIILGVGLPVAIVGQIVILKRKSSKKAQQDKAMYSQYQQQEQAGSSSSQEETARNYIEQYKSEYPKESIKQGLVNMGISDADADSFISKYF